MLLHRTLCILILVLFSILLPATDQHRRDSLKAQIEEDIADSTRMRLLFDLAEEVGASDTLLTFSYLERGEAIAETLNDIKGLGRYYKILGKVNSRCGSYKKAILHYDRALAYFNETDDHVNFFETIKEKGNVYLFQSEHTLAMNHYQTALDYYRRNNMVIGISRCLNNMGIIHKNRGDYVEALSVYQESVVYLDSVQDALDISQAFINMGNLFVLLGGYERAMEYFGKALEIAERKNAQRTISLCLSNSGVIQNKIGNYDEALNLYQRSLKVSRSHNDPVQESNCLINIGTNYADMGEPEKGLEYVQQGMEIKIELEDERIISNCYIHMAVIHTMIEEYEKAIELLNRAIPHKEKLEDPDGLIRCYLGLGTIAVDQERYGEAERMADMALEIAREIHAMEYMADGYLIKREIAVKRDDYRSAYQYAMQHRIYSDSLMYEATSKAAMEMEFRTRSKVLQQENENLRIQSNLDQLLVRRKTLIFRTSLVIVSVLVLGLIHVLYFMRRHKKTSLKLEEKNLVITKQNLKLDQVNKTKDRMMSIIAHDLRGPIGNQLTAVEVLNRIEGDENVEIDRKRLLSNLKNSASYSLELLENLLHWSRLDKGASNYHPEEVKLNTLVNNCLSLYSESAISKKLEFIEEINGVITCYADRIMMETIYRNLISNAIKFSNPGGTITIGLSNVDGMTHFRVSDQGIGITEEEARKITLNGGVTRRGTANEKGAGMGLTLVREFTKLHNGTLSITSEPNKGSTFEVVIPCIN
ncbi:MAG: tetratricopeptide repeat protein [Bacteroidales bacterium]|nr:tetratricopeptide repeat protein [Bacteroidales bacterium]